MVCNTNIAGMSALEVLAIAFALIRDENELLEVLDRVGTLVPETEQRLGSVPQHVTVAEAPATDDSWKAELTTKVFGVNTDMGKILTAKDREFSRLLSSFVVAPPTPTLLLSYRPLETAAPIAAPATRIAKRNDVKTVTPAVIVLGMKAPALQEKDMDDGLLESLVRTRVWGADPARDAKLILNLQADYGFAHFGDFLELCKAEYARRHEEPATPVAAPAKGVGDLSDVQLRILVERTFTGLEEDKLILNHLVQDGYWVDPNAPRVFLNCCKDEWQERVRINPKLGKPAMAAQQSKATVAKVETPTPTAKTTCSCKTAADQACKGRVVQGGTMCAAHTKQARKPAAQPQGKPAVASNGPVAQPADPIVPGCYDLKGNPLTLSQVMACIAKVK